ncbi:class I SAM-dependent methyltransferase [Kitasatospora sp. NPDC089913]|uniref:class I SAM-dependent methyltransferase n=1 Tax=Kitasatospora sp. NPDC089913 TaxID=3364080 RepID=UPI0037F20088
MSSAFCNRRHSVLAALGQVRGERVLDLGCGTGLCSRLLKAQGAGLVVGQDVSEGMLSYARAQEPAGHRGIEYVHALPPALEGTRYSPFTRWSARLCALVQDGRVTDWAWWKTLAASQSFLARCRRV